MIFTAGICGEAEGEEGRMVTSPGLLGNPRLSQYDVARVCEFDPPTAVVLMQVWFQNRRSKERRMKQLSALGARRHAFFRGPRRMRHLGGRLEDPDILGPGAYGYYGGKTKPPSLAVFVFLFFFVLFFNVKY